MPEFSIIVPIYKVEKYLEICIDSIIGQSFCNFELILVDDGSPDTCGEICDRYSSSDTRVKVVHKENGGLSSARNAGLDIATGKYVIFIDSDDFWDDASALEHIHINLTETDADVLVFTAKRYYESEDKYTYIITSDVDRTKIIDKDVNASIRYMIENNIYRAAAWNKVVKKSIIDSYSIVCIHAPFPGKFGAYFTTLTRVAVPIFFMITGYFYGDTVARHKENRQIRKIFYLVVRANSIFFIWNIALGILKRDSIVTYVRKIFTGKSILKFLVLNESPLAGHLWYLGAILYVLVIVLLVDRFNCKKVLYYLTPVLLIADLVFGKYSLLIFHREFPYILVRNFLCVGIPYFCIGNLIREKRCSEKWNRKILQVLIVVFTITSLAERFVLVSAGLNATRDHYLSTTFLAICLFVYTLKSNWHNKGLAVIGRKCSTWLYIIHPIFITAFSVATGKLGIKSIYRCVAPIVTYCATLTFLIVMCRLKSLLVKNNQRK